MRKHCTSHALALLLAGFVFAPTACSPGGSAARQESTLTIKGSDTMVHLVTTWAEAYMIAHPEASLSVTGGGSGTGVAALMNGATDICMTSRDLNPEETALAGTKGLQLQQTAPAMDGIAVIVNPQNPVAALSLAQLQALYTGAATRWSAVGGPDEPVLLVSRESSSGTYVFFQEHVLAKKDYATSTRLLPASSGIIEAVAADRWAIGYAGLGYALEAGDRVKILGVQKDDTAPAILPTEATVLDATYPIARPLLLISPEGGNALADAFLAFCTGPEGQAIVREEGYVPVR